MKQPKLNYQFHNPNTVEASAEYLTQLFIESSAKKVKQTIQTAVSQKNISLLDNINSTP